MKVKLLVSACALLCLGSASAQFNNAYIAGQSPNNSGFSIEQFGGVSTRPLFGAAMTSYKSRSEYSSTNGVRIIGFDFTGTTLYDKLYPLSEDMQSFDMCQGTRGWEYTYLTTGYANLNGLNQMFILQVKGDNGSLVNSRYYTFTGPYKDYHMQGLSITPYDDGYAVVGFATRSYPTPSDAPFQTQEMFIASFDADLNPRWITLFDYRLANANFRDMAMHVTNVPGLGFHITGACESNLSNGYEAVLNMMVAYDGTISWENSILDVDYEKAEIGQYSIYDPRYDMIFMLTYKASSANIGVYAVDPYTGSIIGRGARFWDPNGYIRVLYGLRIDHDPINSDDLLINGYVVKGDETIFPTLSGGGMPTFLTSINIQNLLNSNSGGSRLMVYENPNAPYRLFNFSNNLLANSNPVLNIPSSIGYNPQMALTQGDANMMVSPVLLPTTAVMFQPDISRHTNLYEDPCVLFVMDVKYEPCRYVYTPLIRKDEDRLDYQLYRDVVEPRYATIECRDFLSPRSSEAETDLEQPAGETRLYPTLVHEAISTLTLEFTADDSREIAVTIYDASGRLIGQVNKISVPGANKLEIRAENLATGVNLVKVTGLSQPFVQKVIRN